MSIQRPVRSEEILISEYGSGGGLLTGASRLHSIALKAYKFLSVALISVKPESN
jgi:hypothetical protein